MLGEKIRVLRFGCFTLTSGRRSPYFIDMVRCRSASQLVRLGAFVSASRSILYAYGAFPGFDGTREGYRASVRAQAQAMQRDVYAALKAHCLQMDY